MIRRLKEKDAEVQSLRAWATIKWRREGRGESGEHAILIQRPDHLRLDGLSPIGTSLYTLVMHDGVMELFVPTERRAYRGPASPQTLARFLSLPVSADDALSILCGRIPLCISEEASVHADEGLWVLKVACQRDGWHQSVRLNSSHLDPIGFQLLDPGGREILNVTWGDFQALGETRLPTEIWVEMPLTGTQLQVRLDDPELNPPLPKERFRLILPPGTEISPFS